MQVNVKTRPMNAIPDDMNLIRKKINTCMLDLAQVRRDLASLSGLEEQVIRLKKCEEKLEVQARYCALFGNTVNQICRQYINTENIVIDYSESVRKKAARESFKCRNLKELYPLFNELFFSKGGD